jgi:hypothetical protein
LRKDKLKEAGGRTAEVCCINAKEAGNHGSILTNSIVFSAPLAMLVVKPGRQSGEVTADISTSGS